MADQLNLTAAELAFLLTDLLHDPSAWHRLGITDAERETAVLQAGLASLLVRGLAVADQDDFLLAPTVAGVAAAVASPLLTVHIGLVGDGHGDTSFPFRTADAALLLAPRAHRCFELIGLDLGGGLAGPLVTIVAGFLDTYPPAVATIVVQTAAMAATGMQPRSFVVAADTTDPGWSFAADTDTAPVVNGITRG